MARLNRIIIFFAVLSALLLTGCNLADGTTGTLLASSDDLGKDEEVEIPEALPDSGYLYEGTGQTIAYTDLSPWDALSTIETVEDDDEGTALKMSGGTGWGTVQCLAFQDVGSEQTGGPFSDLYSTVTFKVKAESATDITVFVDGKEADFTITAKGTQVDGTDWYELAVDFSDLTGSYTYEGWLTFIADGTFYITDVEFS